MKYVDDVDTRMAYLLYHQLSLISSPCLLCKRIVMWFFVIQQQNHEHTRFAHSYRYTERSCSMDFSIQEPSLCYQGPGHYRCLSANDVNVHERPSTSSLVLSVIVSGDERKAVGTIAGEDGRKWLQWANGYSAFDAADFSACFQAFSLVQISM